MLKESYNSTHENTHTCAWSCLIGSGVGTEGYFTFL